jgi:hypothetical protein
MRLTALACLGALLFAVPAYAQDSGEIAFWESVKDSKNPAELQAYLQAYPQGKFAPLARLRITELGGTPNATPPVATPPAPTEQNPPAAEVNPPPQQPAQSTETPAAAQNEWSEFRSAKGAFVVLLPGQPKVDVNPPDPTGRGETRYVIDLGDTAYIVAFDDYAPGHLTNANPISVLDTAQDALLKALNGKLRQQRPTTISGFPGREVLFDTPDHNTGKVRVYVVKNRLYQVWYLGPTGRETRPEVDRFLNSFQLTSR